MNFRPFKKYAENWHQKGGVWIIDDYTGPSVATAERLSGPEMGYNNFLDADAAMRLIREFPDGDSVVVIFRVLKGNYLMINSLEFSDQNEIEYTIAMNQYFPELPTMEIFQESGNIRYFNFTEGNDNNTYIVENVWKTLCEKC